MNTILTDDERPKLPFSPYLFTEWRSESERVSSTMYTAEQMEAYADAREAAVLAKLREQDPVMIYRGRCTVDCGEHGHHDVELLKMIPAGSDLYAAPLPAVVQVPQGWKLVPVEPTTEMLGAADREHAARGLVSIALISYRAMLAAAPEAPAQGWSPQGDVAGYLQDMQRMGRDLLKREGLGVHGAYMLAAVEQLRAVLRPAADHTEQHLEMVPAPWREAVKVAREDFRCLLSYVERAAAGADVAWSDLMEDVGKDCRAALAQLDSLEGGE